MADTIQIGALTFEVRAAAAQTAAAVLRHPVPAGAIWRKVWSWDGTQGRPLVAMREGRSVPLGNALVFYRPKVLRDGAVVIDPNATRRMATNFVREVGARDLEEIVRALTEVVMAPRKVVPFEAFDPLNPVAAYQIVQHTDYAVIELAHRPRDVSAYLCLPNRVSYHHEITRKIDPEGFDALMEDRPDLRNIQPSFVVPSRTRPNRRLRLLALRARAELLKTGHGDAARRPVLLARLEEELSLLTDAEIAA